MNSIIPRSVAGQLAFVALVGIVSPVAGAAPLRVYVDRSGSLYHIELGNVASASGLALRTSAAHCTQALNVDLIVWTGSGLSARTPTKHFHVVGLNVPECTSPLQDECDALREEAEKRLAAQRRPELDCLERALREAGTLPLKPSPETCMAEVFLSAALSGRALIITDAVAQHCIGGSIPAAPPHSHIVVVVVAHTADGDHSSERTAQRVATLRRLGYLAVDALQLDSVDWSALVCKDLR